MRRHRITFRAILLGAIFSGIFAVLTVVLINRRDMYPTGIQIPLFPYVLLLLTLFLINPLCALVRVVRRFTQTEILIIWIMGTVSAGISSFGLVAPLVPLMGSLFNPHWNNSQSEWNLYVTPFVKEHFFVSEPGIQAAAKAYRAAVLRTRELEHMVDAASRHVQAEKPAAETADESARTWEDLAREQALPSAGEVVRTYPAMIAAAEEQVKSRREALRKLETEAFKKVELFRRGLPRDLRAFPGAIPVVQEDDAGTYFSRLRRLVYGKRAAGQIKEARKALGDRDREQTDIGEALSRLDAAAEALAPIAPVAARETQLDELRQEQEALTRQRLDLDAELRTLNEQKRAADVTAADALSDRIDALRGQRKNLQRALDDAGVSRERMMSRLDAAQRVDAARHAVTSVRGQLAEGHVDPPQARAELKKILRRFPSFDASLRRFFLGDVPWSVWLRPFFFWGVLIGLTYLVLMTFNVLIFRQWAYNEKLSYPLAQLPELLLGTDTKDASLVPPIFRRGLFWCGFGVAAGVLGWNLLCATAALPGLQPFDLVNSWREYLVNTPFAGLSPGARSSIFFTMIGLAFLIPKNVSFSLWFFWIVYEIQLLIMVWSGVGQGEPSFPTEWWYTTNFRTAEGGGALIVFSSVVLYKCRRYLFCVFAPRSLDGLPADERHELRISSFLFLAGSLGVLLMLWKGMGVNVFCAVLAYALILLTTIGLVRAVAEGGILSYKAYFGTFHFIRNVFGFNRPLTSLPFIAPLMVFYSVTFLDIKCFIAPAMANGLKIRDNLRMERGRFHLSIILCIVVATVCATLALVMISYTSGADSMNRWFGVGFPRHLFERIVSMGRTAPTATASGRLWLGVGGVAMTALLYFRQRMFWLPHPLGMVMLMNPIMQTFWFSIFLGWIAKSLVIKYGNKTTYKTARTFFVGLIVGELVVVAISMALSLILGQNLGIDLNRN